MLYNNLPRIVNNFDILVRIVRNDILVELNR